MEKQKQRQSKRTVITWSACPAVTVWAQRWYLGRWLYGVEFGNLDRAIENSSRAEALRKATALARRGAGEIVEQLGGTVTWPEEAPDA